MDEPSSILLRAPDFTYVCIQCTFTAHVYGCMDFKRLNKCKFCASQNHFPCVRIFKQNLQAFALLHTLCNVKNPHYLGWAAIKKKKSTLILTLGTCLLAAASLLNTDLTLFLDSVKHVKAWEKSLKALHISKVALNVRQHRLRHIKTLLVLFYVCVHHTYISIWHY